MDWMNASVILLFFYTGVGLLGVIAVLLGYILDAIQEQTAWIREPE